ncbi:MAG: DUF3662 domain-containing protein [Anaerolineae bacterium]|nr:DUF3662 domain-containing protein [Anaerolineae bacterium]
MKKKRLSGFEDRLERLIEGGFARLFGGTLHSREVAVQLGRAIEDHLLIDQYGREVAPTYYEIALSPDDHDTLLIHTPDLAAQLGGEVIAYCQEAGLHLPIPPEVIAIADRSIPAHALRVTVRHLANKATTTQIMETVPGPPPAVRTGGPPNAQLIIDATRVIPLNRQVFNIGRHPDNDLVLSDLHVSRHHLQLRLRNGRYTLYDADSKSGTRVNGQMATEHILSPGDLIQIGGTSLLYMEDEPDSLGDTQLDGSPIDLPKGPTR